MVWWTRFSPPAVTSSPKSPNRKRDAQYHSPERTPLLFLRQNRNAGEPARLRAGRRAHLRRVHRHLQRNDGPERHRAGPRRRTPAHPAGNQGPPRRIRHRAGRGQKILAVAVHNHYKRVFYADALKGDDGVELEKSNILLVGPPGAARRSSPRRWPASCACRSPSRTPPR